ncbi:MAG: ABC transporter permease, partial [Flavobacteriaceae bacterium]|nr:ABC transporter permease [Flavobacteriaceae bacterium]
YTKSSSNAINIITGIAVLGVIVGTIALFIVLSVFSGLKDFSLDFIRVSDPDLKISAGQGKSFIFNDTIAAALKDPDIAHFTKVLEEKALFSYQDKSQIANIKGVDENYLAVNNIDTAIYVGDWMDKDAIETVVIGNGISAALSLGTYDYIDALKVYVPKPGTGYINNPKTAFNEANLQPVGVFRLTDELDKKYVFARLPLVQYLLNYTGDRISAVEIKLKPGVSPNEVLEKLETKLGDRFKVQTREQLNVTFYKMLNTENLVSYLIFTLILIIALFNVIGAIVMMILDKRENIKTLFNLGATLKEIKRIFVYQGLLLTVLGLGIGLTLAIIMVLIQKNFGVLMITESLAYPVEFRIFNVLAVIVTILFLGYLAALIASSRISKNMLQ